MSIATKTGDRGETALMYGRRVSKTHPRVEAYGCVDELTAALGIARAGMTNSVVRDEILLAQKDLIIVMGELATSADDLPRYEKDGFKITTEIMVDRLTSKIVDLEKDKKLYPKDWVIPGGNLTAAALDGARAACRRAERRVVALAEIEGALNCEIVRYLNRLSDLLWLLARYAEKHANNLRKNSPDEA